MKNILRYRRRYVRTDCYFCSTPYDYYDEDFKKFNINKYHICIECAQKIQNIAKKCSGLALDTDEGDTILIINMKTEEFEKWLEKGKEKKV